MKTRKFTSNVGKENTDKKMKEKLNYRNTQK